MKHFPAALLFALTVCLANSGRAEPEYRQWLHFDGYTLHFNAPDTNPYLLGLGITSRTRGYPDLRTAWEADFFQDSARQLAGYVGYSWTKPITNVVGLGITGAVMYHRNFKTQDNIGVLPVGLPFVEFGRYYKVRAYYIPPIRSKHDNQIALQALVPF